MRNYSNDVVNRIQKCINSGKYDFTPITSPNDLPRFIYLGGAKIVLEVTDANRYDAILVLDETFDRNDAVEWRQEPLGLFYCKDWKRINKGDERYKLYAELNVLVDGVKVTALIRNINADEFTNETVYEHCSHLNIEGNNYAIIKAFSPSIEEGYSKKSTLEEDTFQIKILSTYGNGFIKIDGDNDEIVNIEDIPDDTESIELF